MPGYIHFNIHHFGRSSTTLPTLHPKFGMKAIFNDNSRVCYKPHSLASGGVGTVRNSSRKALRT